MAWDRAHDPTNPDASPVFDGIGWADYWSAADWITWHAAMRARYGLDFANRVFITAWSSDSLLNSAPLSARTFDENFRAYARANGFYDALFNGLGVLAKPIGAGVDVIEGVSTAGEALRIVVPLLVVGGLAFIAWRYANSLSPATR